MTRSKGPSLKPRIWLNTEAATIARNQLYRIDLQISHANMPHLPFLVF